MSNVTKDPAEFIRLCSLLTNAEFDGSMTDADYYTLAAQMKAEFDGLTMQQLADLYKSGKVHPRFCK